MRIKPVIIRFKVVFSFFHFTNIFLLTGGNVNVLESLESSRESAQKFFHRLWKKVYITLPFFISSGEMPASFPIKNRLLGSVEMNLIQSCFNLDLNRMSSCSHQEHLLSWCMYVVVVFLDWKYYYPRSQNILNCY